MAGPADITSYCVEKGGAGPVDITSYCVEKGGGGAAPPCSCGPHGTGRTYHGNAEPEGASVVVGGREVAVGGWAAYEVARRRARWDANPHDRNAEPSRRYGGRTNISGQDVLESLFAGGGPGRAPGDPLRPAAERLAAGLEALDRALAERGRASAWERLGLPRGTPIVVSPLAPDDIRCAGPETDVDELHQLAEDVAALTAGYAGARGLLAPEPPAALPPLPRRSVAVRNNEGVARLEQGCVPRAEAVEAYRAEVAALFDAAAVVLEAALAPTEAAE